MSRRRLLTRIGPAAAGAMALAATASACAGRGGWSLMCRHQRTGEVYAEVIISAGSLITHSWIHSIELSRWTDTFRFDGAGLVLISTSFQEYGAGMPLDEGDVTVEDGTVTIENIDREFDAIRWIHSHRVDYRIGVDGNLDAIAAEALPEGEPVELRPR